MIVAAPRTPRPGTSIRCGWSARTNFESRRSISLMRRVSDRMSSSRSRAISATAPVRSWSWSIRSSSSWYRCNAREGMCRSGSISCRNQRTLDCIAVRRATSVRRWSESSLISRAGPGSSAVGKSSSRSATRATASASIGSDLPGSRPERRIPAMSRVWTRTTLCPASRRSASSRRVRCRQSSTATRAPWNCSSQLKIFRCPSARASTVSTAIRLPTSSTATSVCQFLWASTPTTVIPDLRAVTDGTAPLNKIGHASVGHEQAGSYQATTPNSGAGPAERHIVERPRGQRRNEPTPPDQGSVWY